MDPNELILTAARAFAVYVFMLIVIRALGKRTVGNFSAFDLLVARMNEADVLAHLRERGIHDMREVHLAVVEADGAVSVLKKTDRRDAVPPGKATDAPLRVA